MKKLFGLTTLFVFGAASAYAGSVAFVAPVVSDMVVEEPGSMGGSGMWLLPLLAIALIFLVMKQPSQPSQPPSQCTFDCPT